MEFMEYMFQVVYFKCLTQYQHQHFFFIFSFFFLHFGRVFGGFWFAILSLGFFQLVHYLGGIFSFLQFFHGLGELGLLWFLWSFF